MEDFFGTFAIYVVFLRETYYSMACFYTLQTVLTEHLGYVLRQT